MDWRDNLDHILWVDNVLHVRIRDTSSTLLDVHLTMNRAKILAHIILDDPKLRSYSDIGRKAFGARSSPFIGALFCLELFTVR